MATGNPTGRPKGSKNKKVSKKTGNPVGRPPGERAVMAEYRQRMLNSPRSKKVIDSIFSAALDDDHKNQSAAWKLIMDRIVPTAGFEKEALGASRAAIQVNISGVPGVDISTPEDTIEGDYNITDVEVPSE